MLNGRGREFEFGGPEAKGCGCGRIADELTFSLERVLQPLQKVVECCSKIRIFDLEPVAWQTGIMGRWRAFRRSSRGGQQIRAQGDPSGRARIGAIELHRGFHNARPGHGYSLPSAVDTADRGTRMAGAKHAGRIVAITTAAAVTGGVQFGLKGGRAAACSKLVRR